MTRESMWTVVVATAMVVVTACSGADTAPDPTRSVPDETTITTSADAAGSAADSGETATTSASGPQLNTLAPIADGVERAWPQEVGRVSEGDKGFSLFGVHRIDSERVVVTGRITGVPTSSTASAEWFEPGYFQPSGGYEFSRVAVHDSDGVRHLPVRDADDRCLCSLSTHPYDDLEDPQAPAWAVMSVSPGTDVVDVEIADVGTIEDVPITQLPATSSVPFGWQEVLTVESLTREDGVLTARTTIANPGEVPVTYVLSRHMFQLPDLQGQHCFQGLAAWGTSEPTGRLVQDEGCFRGGMPQQDQQIMLDVKIADPGTEQVVILPDAGLPISVPATGTALTGPELSLRTYTSRTEQAGTTVHQTEDLTLHLNTEVLFAFDEATLTGSADEALTVAAEALQAQDERTITVAGHTDGQGSAQRNQELSRQRAEAVASALETQLGRGWDINVEWHGMDRPVAKETGTPEQVEAAQARNRRVEIVVP